MGTSYRFYKRGDFITSIVADSHEEAVEAFLLELDCQHNHPEYPNLWTYLVWEEGYYFETETYRHRPPMAACLVMFSAIFITVASLIIYFK